MKFSKWQILSLITILLWLPKQGLLGKPSLKNIIIISVDTLRADHLGCYGYPLETSPAIDRLAKDGILILVGNVIKP